MIQKATILTINFQLHSSPTKLMVESLLFSFAESLIGKLASSAVQEASFALGVHGELKQMKATMALIKAVLLDAEQKKSKSTALSEWLRQIKHVFSDAVDIVDDFECEALRKHVVNTYGGYSRKVRRFFSTSNPFVYRLRMVRQIKDIKERLEKVAADRNMFGLQIIDQDTRVVHVREMTHSHVNPSKLMGREHDKQKIIKLLLQDCHQETLSVIPIVGMGGLGKTTLAKLVFNDTHVQECFPLKMWACVSDDFELKNVLVKILNSAPNPTMENFENFDTEQLQNLLRKKFESQKFLLVLDDVWNEDRLRWDELKEIIDVGVEGCKILMTTRNHSIATMMCTESSNSYFLKCLSEEDSLSLFMKSAFEDGDEKKHPELLEIGKEIVKKCGGLPLAMKTLGSSLFSKVDKKEWESMRDNEIWNLKQNEKGILPALKLSYDQLPSYLKPCFASFSLYNQGTYIIGSRVTMLWAALGFLPPEKENESIIDVASQLLRELRSRSFISDYLDVGDDCTFKLHDLVRDFSVYIAKGEFEIMDPHNLKISEYAQHLKLDKNVLGQAILPTGLRTVHCFDGANNEAFLNTLVAKCKYLRVLNLHSSEYENLPRCFGKLKHLRYLNLANNKKLKQLPDSLCKLQNLQTLIFNGCIKLQKLPKGFRNLISLRHLSITTNQPDFFENEIASLTSLQTLYVASCDNGESLFNGIQLPNLRSLSLGECGNLKSVSFHAIRNLEVLMILKCSKFDFSMLSSQVPSSRLKFILLKDLPPLDTLPQWFQGSMNSLHSLWIHDCVNFEELPEWLSTMNHLKVMTIMNCPKLLSFPDNMHHLEYLGIAYCPELYKRFQPEVGQDWHKISHIKQVHFGKLKEEN